LEETREWDEKIKNQYLEDRTTMWDADKTRNVDEGCGEEP
jgi:hypothetical protein